MAWVLRHKNRVLVTVYTIDSQDPKRSPFYYTMDSTGGATIEPFTKTEYMVVFTDRFVKTN